MATSILRTVLFQRHIELGAQMVPFGGWEMPVHYTSGILREHLFTRRQAGLFDVSHMGRFSIRGPQALAFLQHVLTNNAAALDVGESQYTMIADPQGGAIDDAYLYRFFEDAFLLVVNAANRDKDWRHLETVRGAYGDVILEDLTDGIAMFSLQGPQSKAILTELIGAEGLPEPRRNALSISRYNGGGVWVARTGYTGEPLCFELFLPAQAAVSTWDRLVDAGARPVGLGARDTLRLEAGLPLFGHELGEDPEGRPIPIFALSLARFAVSFSSLKGEFIGRAALLHQFQAYQAIAAGNFSRFESLPRMVRSFEVIDKGIARAGAVVRFRGQPAGHVTSGTMVPYYRFEGRGIDAVITDRTERRAIGLALIDSRIPDDAEIDIEVRGKTLSAGVMPYLLRSEAPPYARAITWSDYRAGRPRLLCDTCETAPQWIKAAIDNSLWRQQACINLIPSEMTPSALVRLLSIQDPSGRYAEHKAVKALGGDDVFYYQGTDFIAAVEQALSEELRRFLSCRQVETRPVSGQMANTVVFSAMVDFINRADRKSEQRRIRRVMNHHIIRGGHLSAQPMGALRDFVMRDPEGERPAVTNFPVLADNPYAIDVEACGALIERYRPELIILGKSMILHKEPVADLRRIIDDLGLGTVLMYDMAHVLGLVGPHFQQPFAEGADLVTGSTHKTFFGTQRGVVAADFSEEEPLGLELWEAVQRRTFPGAVSNHHLGTLLGLLLAAMEMNAFSEPYSAQVIKNAKTFARALKEVGLDVAGDAAIDFTETHQVIVEVGYAKAPRIARRLEENNIICNYQAAPEEEGFTASGALRLGVAEMTRFGMRGPQFQETAQLMADLILRGKDIKEPVTALRQRFVDMQYCFQDDEMTELLEKLRSMV
jgi:aminomethyltransferase